MNNRAKVKRHINEYLGFRNLLFVIRNPMTAYMNKALVVFLALFLLSACKSERFKLTEEYIYHSEGFPAGFTIHTLKVTEFDTTGLPKEYQDGARVDLENSGGVEKTIWFNKENDGYYWTKALQGKYKTMPLQFEEGVWYRLWSNDFKTGFFKTDQHYFFLHRDAKGFHVYERVRGLNFL